MANVGSAYIAIIPQMKGIKSAIGGELSKAGSDGKQSFSKAFNGAGSEAGKKVGGEFSKAFGSQKFDTSNMSSYKQAIKGLEADVKRAADSQAQAQNKVLAAEQKLASARTGSQAAAQKVQIAEKNLADAIAKHGRDSTQAATAQLKYTQALSSQQAAEAKVTTAEGQLSDARQKQKIATESLTRAQSALAGAQKQAASASEQVGAKAHGGLGKLGDIASSVGGKLKSGLAAGLDFVKQNAALMAAAATPAGKALYELGSEFDKVHDTIRIGTGATGKALGDMEGVAKKVATTVPTTFADAASSTADWNTRMGLTGNTLKTVVSQTEALRSMDMAVDINQISAAFQAFGVKGKGVSAGMDQLMRVSQATGVSMDSLAGAVQKNAPALQSMGFSFNEATAMAGMFDKAGLESEQIMASMSRGMVNLAKQGEKPGEAFQRVVGEIEGFIAKGDEASAIDLAGKIFGTRGAPQMVAALKSGVVSLKDMNAAMGASGDTILGLRAETESFAEKWQMVKEKAKLALEPVAMPLFDALGKAIDAVSSAMDSIGKGKGLGSFLGGAAPVLGGLLGLLGPLATQIPIVGGAFAGLTGPVGLAVGAIIGIVSQSKPLQDALMALVKSFAPLLMMVGRVAAELMSALGPVLGEVGDALVPVVDAVTQVVATLTSILMPVIEALVPVIKTVLSAVGPLIAALTPLISAILSIVGTALAPLIAYVKAVLVPMIQAVLPVVSAVISSIMGVITPAVAIISGIVSALAALLRGDFSGAWKAMQGVVTNVIKLIRNYVTGQINIIKTVISSELKFIQTVFGNVWGGIKNIVQGAWENIKSLATTGVSGMLQAIVDGLKNMVSSMGQAWESTKWAVSDAWNAMVSCISGKIGAAVGLLGGFPGRAVSALGNLGNLLVHSGKAMLDGLARGIRNGISGAINAVKGGLRKIRSFFPFSPAKRGPFSGKGWTLYSGMAIAESLGEGIRRREDVAAMAAGSLAAKTRNALDVTSRQFAASNSKTAADSGGVMVGAGQTVNITQNIATATTPAASKLASDAAAAARIWGVMA